jgi:predicted membrane channel-forming protein YqfA (hemolysin III family)
VPDVDLGDVLWAMLAFLFWVMFFWMFIAVFADIFRRRDLTGWGKAGWIVLVFVLPFIGLLIYVITRPRMSEEELRLAGSYGYQGSGGPAAADEVAKLAKLRDAGDITSEEYERMKSQALARA